MHYFLSLSIMEINNISNIFINISNKFLIYSLRIISITKYLSYSLSTSVLKSRTY